MLYEQLFCREANVMLLADPLPAVNLHFVIDPIVSCLILLVLILAVLEGTNIWPKVPEHMTPANISVAKIKVLILH